MNNFLESYKTNGFHKVEGWCSEALFETIDILASCGVNKNGGALEIGIHHGKLFILLNCVIEKKFRSYAIDVFENQDLNIDKSGYGSLYHFKSNLEKYDRHKGENVDIISGDSIDYGLNLENRIGRSTLRFISIDGGHTAEHTISDLILSNILINNEGIVILDDILNYHWTGVIEGVFKFLERKPTLVPFGIGHNKLYMCKLSYKKYYFDLFEKLPIKSKIIDFFGHATVAL